MKGHRPLEWIMAFCYFAFLLLWALDFVGVADMGWGPK